MKKPILCLDFDGVIHSYTSGWKGVGIIADPPVPGAMDFIRRAQQHFEVAISSSRSQEPEGIAAMKRYVQIDGVLFPATKPPAFVTLDDRAITFTGKWPDPEKLLDFKPWYKL